MTWICPECGHENPDETFICEQCGRPRDFDEENETEEDTAFGMPIDMLEEE